MKLKSLGVTLGLALIASTGAGIGNATAGQVELVVPQSLRVEHDTLASELEEIAQRYDKLAGPARKALDLLKPHWAREAEYVLPPLGLLPALADGKVTPDMKAAIAMADRVKADRALLLDEHAQITAALGDLLVAAEAEHQPLVLHVAQAAALHALNEIEVLEPTAIMIGEYLQTRLASGN